MDIVLIVLLSVVLLLLLLLLVLLLFQKKGASSNKEVEALLSKEHDEAIRRESALQGRIDLLEKAMLSSLEKNEASYKADARLLFSELSEKNLLSQRDFQEKMASSLSNSLSTMNERIDKNLERINLQVEKSLKNAENSAKTQTESLQNTYRLAREEDAKRLISFEERITKSLDEKMSRLNEKVDTSLLEGFKSTSLSMASLQKELGIVQEAQRKIGDLEGQIQSLNAILSNNQERGLYGEWQLELLLRAIFGENKGLLYETQYPLGKVGTNESLLKPDAVIFLDGKERKHLLAIDAKFSLRGYEALLKNEKMEEKEKVEAKRSFRSALRERIQECAKYIVPGLTMNNAIMYIPSDGIFSYLHSEFPDLLELAKEKGVVLASPSIMQPLLASFRILQFDAEKSKNIERINRSLNVLSVEFRRFLPRWESLRKGIDALTGKSEQLDTTIKKIDRRFLSINEGKGEGDKDSLNEKPSEEGLVEIENGGQD